jgi:hypothetical protein
MDRAIPTIGTPAADHAGIVSQWLVGVSGLKPAFICTLYCAVGGRACQHRCTRHIDILQRSCGPRYPHSHVVVDGVMNDNF